MKRNQQNLRRLNSERRNNGGKVMTELKAAVLAIVGKIGGEG